MKTKSRLISILMAVAVLIGIGALPSTALAAKKEEVISGTQHYVVSGDHAYVAKDDGLYRCKVDGSEKTKLNSVKAKFPAVIGDSLYFYGGQGNYRNDTLYRSNLDGRNLKSMKKITSGFISQAKYYNGKIYYFTLSGERTYNLQVANLDGNKPKTIMKSTFPQFVIWTVGDNGVFCPDFDGIVKTDVNGKAKKTYAISTNITAFATAGDYMYYGDSIGIYKMSIKTGKTEKLTSNELTVTEPRGNGGSATYVYNYEPKLFQIVGNQLIYSAKNPYRNGELSNSIYRMNLDGTGKTELYRDTGIRNFQANGNFVYIQSYTGFEKDKFVRIGLDGSQKQVLNW